MLEIRDLAVTYAGAAGRPAVESASLRVEPGQTAALVGESGSGKSSIALAVMGLIDPRVGCVAGRVELRSNGSTDVYQLGSSGGSRRNRLGRRRMAMIFQEPALALHPMQRVGTQIAEALRLSRDMGRQSARREAIELLRQVGIGHPERRVDCYAHELSGGMAQRVMIAMALARDPIVLIADEPTTSLDATVEVQILDLIRQMQRQRGMGVLLISHDLNLVRRRADHIYVCHAGRIVEEGPAERVVGNPTHAYTQSLVSHREHREFCHREHREHRGCGSPCLPVVEIGGVSVEFAGSGGTVRAVNEVDLVIERGQTVGLVGESGCGKSTLGKVIVGLVRPQAGRVRVFGQDVWGASRDTMRGMRRKMQMIFQNAAGSLNPRMTVGRNVVEPLRSQGLIRRSQWRTVAGELLERVGLSADMVERMPTELSAGQRQRVAIARAIGPRPEFVVCDEPVSSLDATVQTRILDLLTKLQQEMNLSYLFISHDLRVVRWMADCLAVMYAGAIVETGPTQELMTQPRHPYTMLLLAAAGLGAVSQQVSDVEAALPMGGEQGCVYQHTCPWVEQRCRQTNPVLTEIDSPRRRVACHRASEIRELIGASSAAEPQPRVSDGVRKGQEGNSDDSSCKDRGAG